MTSAWTGRRDLRARGDLPNRGLGENLLNPPRAAPGRGAIGAITARVSHRYRTRAGEAHRTSDGSKRTSTEPAICSWMTCPRGAGMPRSRTSGCRSLSAVEWPSVGSPYMATDGQNQMSAATHPSPLSSSYERVHRPASARSLRQSCDHTRCSNAWHKSVAGHRLRSRVATTNGGRFISRWSSFRHLSDYCR